MMKIEPIKTQECRTCKETKIIHEFPQNYRAQGGITGDICKLCKKNNKGLSEIEHLRKVVPPGDNKFR